jgi:radical SAM superfamily enzyme YgiQ (UPF0313 family)
MAGRQHKRRIERLARERGAIRRAWGDRLSVCLLYANRYATGMSNLGFQTVYGLLNTLPSVVCERAFLPDPEDVPSHPSGSPNLTSLESGRPLGDFDVVAFSLSFENDYPNVLKLLSLGRIEPLASRRGPQDPLILAGGVAVTLNPEPLADFVDLFFLGEAEEALSELTARLLAANEEGLGRDECLYGLQREVEGVYVPRWYQPSYRPDGPIESFVPRDPTLPGRVRRRWAARLDPPAEQAVDTPDTALGAMFLTEVSRGCPGAADSVPPGTSTGRPGSGTGRPWRPPCGGGWNGRAASVLWARPCPTTPTSCACVATSWKGRAASLWAPCAWTG